MEQKYVKEAFDTNWVVPMGPNVNAFEEDLEGFVNKIDSSASPQNDNQGAANNNQAAANNNQAPASKPAGAGKAVTSPLPGVIIEVSVKEGQAVKAGQKVAVIEAMKMENEIQASADGTVTAVLVNKGDSVLEGAEIVKIA